MRRSHVDESSTDRRAFLSLAAGAATTLLLESRKPAWAKPPSADDLTRLTLHEAASLVRRRDVSPMELTNACLARIEQYDSSVNSFITVAAQSALQQARLAEKEIGAGNWRGPLHGIPLALKDNIDTAEIRTTAASAVFSDRVPTQDAEVVRSLKHAGAVILGKLNLWEFARSPESHWGMVRNPWALERAAGYTSNGSGAAVAADFCFGALGTDSGGSVRIPASACGVVGLKPTYGLVSNRGIIPGLDSVDHVGPLSKTVLDAALLLQGIAGNDPDWAGSAKVAASDYAAAIRQQHGPFRLGVPHLSLDSFDPEVVRLFEAALKTMSTLGSVGTIDVTVPQYLDITQGLNAEMLAYHAPLFEKAGDRYSPFMRKLLADELKKCVSGIDYVNARHALQAARRRATEIFKDDVDFLVLPTWKRLPMTLDSLRRLAGFIPDELSTLQPFNVLGLPAISVPCGFTKNGLPAGVQIVGRPFAETRLLAFAHAYEQATAWHLRKPVLREEAL